MRRKRKLLSVLILCALCVFTGCGNHSGDISAEHEAHQENETDELKGGMKEQKKEVYVQPEMKGEITISSFYEQEFLTVAARSFMEKYPEVTITVNVYNETPGTGKVEDYQTYLNTRIMTGKAEDIIFNSFLPVTKYAEMGVFEDLSKYIALTLDFNDRNYFLNILESAKEEDGRVFLIPYMAKFDVISFSEALLYEQPALEQEIVSSRFSDRMRIAKELVRNTDKRNVYLIQMNELSYADYLLEDVFCDFIDIKNKTVSIGSEAYKNLLNEVKQLSGNNAFGSDSMDFYNTEYYFAATCDYDVQAAIYELDHSVGISYGMPLADKKGNIAISANGCLALNSSSDHKNLAWEFIKYLLSDEMQASPSLHGLAVNKTGFDAVVERYYNFYSENSRTEIDKEEYAGLLKNWMEQINDCDTVDSAIWTLIEEENSKFFAGMQSAEDTAAILQRKLEQYFNE